MGASEPGQSGGRTGAIEFLRRLRSGEVVAHEVSTQERRICVAYLRLEGYTADEIAEIFGAHRRTITRDEKANRKAAARLVDDLDVRSVAGGLIAWSRHLTAKALKEKDHALAWRIQRELVGDLQALGYLPKAPEQHQVQLGTFVDLARLAAEQPASQVGPAEESAAPKALLEGSAETPAGEPRVDVAAGEAG